MKTVKVEQGLTRPTCTTVEEQRASAMSRDPAFGMHNISGHLPRKCVSRAYSLFPSYICAHHAVRLRRRCRKFRVTCPWRCLDVAPSENVVNEHPLFPWKMRGNKGSKDGIRLRLSEEFPRRRTCYRVGGRALHGLSAVHTPRSLPSLVLPSGPHLACIRPMTLSRSFLSAFQSPDTFAVVLTVRTQFSPCECICCCG